MFVTFKYSSHLVLKLCVCQSKLISKETEVTEGIVLNESFPWCHGFDSVMQYSMELLWSSCLWS